MAELLYSRTKTIQEDKVSGFCPGCMHSTVMKLIGEVIDEMGIIDKTAAVLGIGCCGLQMDYMAYDNTTAELCDHYFRGGIPEQGGRSAVCDAAFADERSA